MRQDGREIYKESVILDKNNIRAKMEFDEEFVNRLLLLEEGGKVIWSTAQGKKKNCIVQAGRMEGICPMRKCQEQCWNSTLQISLK